jgi:hypothetical protein
MPPLKDEDDITFVHKFFGHSKSPAPDCPICEAERTWRLLYGLPTLEDWDWMATQ